MIRRRTFLASLASAAFADPLGLPVGLQLYTVGPEIRKDRDGTLKTIASIGYQEVQLATGLAPDPRELVKAIRGAGLSCRSTHYALAELRNALEQKVATVRDAGLESVVCSFPWLKDPARLGLPAADQMTTVRAIFSGITLDDWKWTADELNRIGEAMKKAGLLFGYHNHNLDFRRFGEVTALDELMRRTDPSLVTLELDCGWATVAGADPVTLIEKYAGRVPLLHVKDQKRMDKPTTGIDGFSRTTEVGSGVVDWKRVFAAAKKAGLRQYYVEQEPPFDMPPLQSIAASYAYLHGLA